MAKVPYVFITEIICFLTGLSEARGAIDQSVPKFELVHVINSSITDHHRTFVFDVEGSNIARGLQVRTTETATPGGPCSPIYSYNISEMDVRGAAGARYALTVPLSFHGKLYFCLQDGENRGGPGKDGDVFSAPSIFNDVKKWSHQGPNVYIDVPADQNYQNGHRRIRQDIISNGSQIEVGALRLQKAYKDAEIDEDGVPVLLADSPNVLQLFGHGFVNSMMVAFTTEELAPGAVCSIIVNKGFAPVTDAGFSDKTVTVEVNLPPMKSAEETYYVCIRDNAVNSHGVYFHQGNATWMQVKTTENMFPTWVTIMIVITCLMFSALFSGLNLGLMSLGRTELKILCNTGTDKEQQYARAITPVRNTGNYLLCSILLGNVFVNSIFTILLDGLTSGLIAVIFSTIAIVLFGEITPQAICSRHGLAVGANTIYITKVVMFLTFPLSYPVSKFLDCILGEEIGNVYTRERLKELVKVTTGDNDLDKDEVNIISGALELRKKTVADVMTKIEDVFMLDYEAVLDFETVTEIMKSGYSRVPVYEGNRQNIVTMLYIKDLAFVDPDDNTPLKTLCQFYQNPCNFVFEDATLDVMFRIFKEGNKGHMAFVHRVNNEGEGDPFYETVGLITLEDVIEELIQAEIMDETDVFTDNRSKRKRNAERRQDFSVFAEKRGESNKIRISPQLTLAAFQYLSTAVEQFVPSVISETILKRLLKQDIVFHVKKNKEWRTDPGNIIYQQGKNADYFVLILEGRVEVTIGKECLTFEGGPFTYFGTQALIQSIGVAESPSVPTSTLGSLESLNLDSMLRHTFQPEYTVRASTEVIYLRIKRSLYLAAKRATLMERSKRENKAGTDNFDEEVDKLLHSLEEDDDGSTGRHSPRKRSSKNLHQSDHSHNTSPKTHSLYCNVSPPRRLSQRDINGSIKSSPVDDIHTVRDEEVSLLPKKS